MRIALVPLDERPVNTRYPAMIAAIAGAELVLPPMDLLCDFREPAPCDRLADWLRETAGRSDALIVSFEMLAYGGLIPSRTTEESTADVVVRLELLRELRRRYPSLVIYGFSVITRVSDADVNFEEPLYWERYGKRLYRYSQLLDRRSRGENLDQEIALLESEVPGEHRRDFLQRRLRNHAFNMAALELLADGTLDLLVMSSDDTSPFGLPSREKRWLAEWAGWLEPGPRLLMYPGADEVGCALLARLINQQRSRVPTFQPCYAFPGGAELVAPYEDGPVRLTVERQVQAVGGKIVNEDADFWLAVNPPVRRRSEWDPVHAGVDRDERLPHLEPMVEELRQRMQKGQRAIVADVSYPNGADPLLVELLVNRIDLNGLAAFGAWNTAGNTIGTALAQGCAALYIADKAQREAQELFLLHRFVEDWGYQQVVRAFVRDWLEQQGGRSEPSADQLDATRAWIEERLAPLVELLPGFAGHYRLKTGSVRLPWRRTFEVDFDLERVRGSGER